MNTYTTDLMEMKIDWKNMVMSWIAQRNAEKILGVDILLTQDNNLLKQDNNLLKQDNNLLNIIKR